MNSEPVLFPWMKPFPLSEEAKKDWEKSKTSKSLLSYGLKHKLIPRKRYFQWAMEHYQIPFLKTEFFQNQAILSQNKWEKVKDLEEWSSEVVPVCLWEGIVYIGCIEPKRKKLPFPHRFVLATDLSLKMHWRTLLEGMEITQTFSKGRVQAQGSAKPSLPEEPEEEAPSPMFHEGSYEGERATILNQKTNQAGATPLKKEEKVVVMEDYKARTTSTSKKSSNSQTLSLNTNTTGIYAVKRDKRYEKLWETIKKHFSGMVIFNREGNKLIPLECLGRIALKDKDFKVSLEDNSLFSIIKKNLPYHGPIIEAETNRNKEILKNMGWETLPQHASAISLTTEEGKNQVFFGVGIRQINMSEIDEITEFIEDFFKENSNSSFKKAS